MLCSPEGAPIFAYVIAYAGDEEAGAQAVAPYRALGEPLADMVQPMPYTALQKMLDDGFPTGLQVYWRAHFLAGLPDDAIDILVAGANAAPSPLNAVLIEQLGGAVTHVGRDETAFDHRDAAGADSRGAGGHGGRYLAPCRSQPGAPGDERPQRGRSRAPAGWVSPQVRARRPRPAGPGVHPARVPSP